MQCSMFRNSLPVTRYLRTQHASILRRPLIPRRSISSVVIFLLPAIPSALHLAYSTWRVQKEKERDKAFQPIIDSISAVAKKNPQLRRQARADILAHQSLTSEFRVDRIYPAVANILVSTSAFFGFGTIRLWSENLPGDVFTYLNVLGSLCSLPDGIISFVTGVVGLLGPIFVVFVGRKYVWDSTVGHSYRLRDYWKTHKALPDDVHAYFRRGLVSLPYWHELTVYDYVRNQTTFQANVTRVMWSHAIWLFSWAMWHFLNPAQQWYILGAIFFGMLRHRYTPINLPKYYPYWYVNGLYVTIQLCAGTRQRYFDTRIALLRRIKSTSGLAHLVSHINFAFQFSTFLQFNESWYNLIKRNKHAHLLSSRIITVTNIHSSCLLLLCTND